MSTKITVNREQKKIFKNFIKKCIIEYPKNPAGVHQQIMDTHGKSPSQIFSMMSPTDMSVDYMEYVRDFTIEYFSQTKAWNQNVFNVVYENFSDFLENGICHRDYLVPLYNFDTSEKPIELNSDIKIRKILDNEKDWFIEHHDYTPIKTQIHDLSHVLILKVDKKNKDPTNHIRIKIRNIIDLLRLFKQGDVRRGGLYYFPRSEKWNPSNELSRIDFEPIGVYSSKKYTLQSDESGKFMNFFNDASKCFPSAENRDFFNRSIRRFSDAIERDNSDEKILDFVISLESLLTSGAGDSTLKLSQRASILLSQNDDEIIDHFAFIRMCYDFRSGIVHESLKREFKMKDVGRLSEKQVISRLEDSTRKILVKMIKFSQITDISNLSHSKITDKIDELLLNRTLWNKYKHLI